MLVIAGKSLEEIQAQDIARWEDMPLAEHMALYEKQGLNRKEAMRQVAKDRGVPKERYTGSCWKQQNKDRSLQGEELFIEAVLLFFMFVRIVYKVSETAYTKGKTGGIAMQETTVYGYVRVSTKEQKEDRQMIALRNLWCRRNIFIWISSAEKILTGPSTGNS